MQFLPPATLSEAGCETFNLLPPGAQPTAGWRAAMVLATLAVTKVARPRWDGTSFPPWIKGLFRPPEQVLFAIVILWGIFLITVHGDFVR